MADRYQQRRDTSTNWVNTNPVLAQGEIGVETDGLHKLKLGNGSSTWTELPYFAPGGITQYAQTIIVAKSGGNYNTITDAQTAITDASTSKRYAIIVYPGDYNENIIDKDSVDIIGINEHFCRIVSTSGTAVTLSSADSDVYKMGITSTLDPATENTSVILASAGSHKMVDCKIDTSRTTGDYLIKAISHTGGNFDVLTSEINYNFTGSSAGSKEQCVISHAGSENMRIDACTIFSNIADSDDVMHMLHVEAAATGKLLVNNSFMHCFSSGMGEVAGLHVVSTGATVSYSAIVLIAMGDIYGARVDGTGTEMKSSFNTITMSSITGTTYTGDVATGCTWESFCDEAVADERATGDGSSKVVTSFAPGSLTISDYLAMPSTGLFTDGTYGYTIPQGYAAYAHSQITGANPHGVAIAPSGIPTSVSGSPSHGQHLQDLMNHYWSTGTLGGFDITNNNDGTVTVASGTAIIRSTDSIESELVSRTIPGGTTGTDIDALVDEYNNFLYIDYNAGTPTIKVTLNPRSLNGRTQIPIYAVTRVGNDAHIVDVRSFNQEYAVRDTRAGFLLNGFAHVPGGTVITDEGNRNFAVSEGLFFVINKELPQAAFDMSGSDDFEYVSTDDSGVTWSKTGGHTEINNIQYNDITSGLTVMDAGNFCCHYLYYVPELTGGEIYIQFGQAQHDKLASAQAEEPPNLRSPGIRAGANAIFIGKIIIKKDETSFSDIQSPFSSTLVSSLAQVHDELEGLNGGHLGEYFHVSPSGYAATEGTNGIPGVANKFVTDSDPRNANARTPTAHKTSHQSGGADAIKLDDLDAPEDNTDLDVSITAHGLTPKLPNDSAKVLDGEGNWVTVDSVVSVFGTLYQYEESTGQSSTTSTTYQQKVRLTTPSLPAGNYRIGYSCRAWQGGTADSFQVKVEIDDATEIWNHLEEMQDITNRATQSGFWQGAISVGAHTIDMDYRQQRGNTAYIDRARLEIWRVS